MAKVKCFNRNKWQRHLLLGISCLFAKTVLGEVSNIEQLYKLFLNDPHKAVFVSFERESLVPERHEETREVKLNDGRTIQIHIYGKDYLGFLKSGNRFLAAYSSKPVATNLSSVTLADRLAGYDGEEHWALDLGAMRLQTSALSSNQTSGPPMAFSRLTVIPGKDIQASTNQVVLQGIMGLATEGYSVAQLGYDYPLTAAPTVEDSDQLTVLDPLSKRLSARLRFKTGGTPCEIEYHASEMKEFVLNVGLDEEKGVVSVKHVYNGKIVDHAVYRVLSVMAVSDKEASTMFSWRSYALGQTNVLAFLIADGTTSKAEIRDGKLIPVRKLYDMQPDRGPINERSRKTVIFILFALTTVGVVLIVRSMAKEKQQN
jgi:hypothetical protein